MKKLLLILLLLPTILFGQMKATDGTFGSAGHYRVYEPIHLKPAGIILYFHGLGERGIDLNLIERNEIPKLFKNGVEKPFIVICPQLSTAKNGWGTAEIIPMLNLVDAYARFYKVEKHVTGLSLGGMATYGALVAAYEYNGNKPGYWKTAVSVCGKSATTNIDAFRITAVKLYHGTADGTVGIGEDYRIVKMLQDAGIPIEFKWYVGYDHGIWNMAYNESADGYWKFLESKIGPLPTPPPAESDTVRVKVTIDTTRPYIIETTP